MSFWTAKEECKSLGGQLLLLENTDQVKEALGDSMVGNVESDYRIDGWSAGHWFEGDKNSTIQVDESEDTASLLTALKSATLTLNLEDGSVLGDRHADTKIGAVCQGQSGNGNASCSNDAAEQSTEAPSIDTTTQKQDDEGCSTSFFMTENKLTHNRAQEECQKAPGGRLARIKSPKDKELVSKLTGNIVIIMSVQRSLLS